MTDINSPQVQAIFAQLHALGVTPEQAAAGVRSLDQGHTGRWPYRSFHIGERIRFARLEGPEVHHSDAPPLGWEGVIDEDDDSSLPFRVTGDAWASGYRSEDAWWFAPEALDRVEPTT